jgi:hypothetical protein
VHEKFGSSGEYQHQIHITGIYRLRVILSISTLRSTLNVRTSREGGEGASYKRPAGQGEEGGRLDGTAEGSHFRRRFGRKWNLRE